MSESRKIVVPEGMIQACMSNGFYPGRYRSPGDEDAVKRILEAALRWLCPQIEALKGEEPEGNAAIDDVLKLFAVPEPEIPEEVKDLMWPGKCVDPSKSDHDANVIEAFNRGRRLGEQP